MNTTKVCSACRIEKLDIEFNKNKHGKHGLRHYCRYCEKCYYISRKEQISTQKREYHQRAEVKERKLVQQREYYEKNKAKIAKQRSIARARNHDQYITRERARKAKDIEKWREYQRNYTKNQRKTDNSALILHRCRNRLLSYVKNHNVKKQASTIELIGCTKEFLINYLESLFTEGMTWEKVVNREIEIHHILSCHLFNFNYLEEQLKCFHYTNLIPLWKKDHIRITKENHWKFKFSQFNARINQCRHYFNFVI